MQTVCISEEHASIRLGQCVSTFFNMPDIYQTDFPLSHMEDSQIRPRQESVKRLLSSNSGTPNALKTVTKILQDARQSWMIKNPSLHFYRILRRES